MLALGHCPRRQPLLTDARRRSDHNQMALGLQASAAMRYDTPQQHTETHSKLCVSTDTWARGMGGARVGAWREACRLDGVSSTHFITPPRGEPTRQPKRATPPHPKHWRSLRQPARCASAPGPHAACARAPHPWPAPLRRSPPRARCCCWRRAWRRLTRTSAVTRISGSAPACLGCSRRTYPRRPR